MKDVLREISLTKENVIYRIIYKEKFESRESDVIFVKIADAEDKDFLTCKFSDGHIKAINKKYISSVTSKDDTHVYNLEDN